MKIIRPNPIWIRSGNTYSCDVRLLQTPYFCADNERFLYITHGLEHGIMKVIRTGQYRRLTNSTKRWIENRMNITPLKKVCKNCAGKKDCFDYIHQKRIEKFNMRFAETKTCELFTPQK